MSDFLYYCKNCHKLVADPVYGQSLTCESCGNEYYSLDVTDDEWVNMTDDEKRDALRNAVMPQKRRAERKLSDDLAIDWDEEEDDFERNRRNSRYNNQRLSKPSNASKSSKYENNGVSSLSIIAFIFSFLGCLSIVGIVLGIIDLLQHNRKKKGLSIAAIAIGVVMMIASIIVGKNIISRNKDTSETTAETSTESLDYKKVDVDGFTYQIPTTYEGGKEGENYYFADGDDAFICFQSTDQSGLSLVDYDDIVELFDDSIEQSMSSYTTEPKLLSQKDGIQETESGIELKYREAIYAGKLEGVDANVKTVIFLDMNNEKVGYMMFGARLTKENADEQYNKIFQSINTTYTTNSESTGESLDTENDNDTQQESDTEKSSSDEVDPNLKAFLDEYEEIVDNYVAIMEKYKANPTDMSILKEYTDMLSNYEEFAKKAEEYDQDEMSDADLAYYLDAMTRIEKKMINVL